MKRVAYVFVGLFVLVSCIEHRKESESSEEPESTEKEFIQEKNYNGLRIYSGSIPCADCSGIQQRLVLKGDSTGIYRLTEVYKDATEDGDAELISTGEWKFKKGSEKGEKILVISQGHLGDSTRVANYECKGSKIVQFTLDGENIPNKNSYTLKLVSQKN